MNGAGFTLNQLNIIGTIYALTSGSTAKYEDMYKWWTKGWNSANSGMYSKAIKYDH